jgi:hypothetical protein
MVVMKDIKNNMIITVPNNSQALKYMKQTDYQLLPLHLRWDKRSMNMVVARHFENPMQMARKKTGKPSTKKETLYVYNTYRRALERGTAMLDTFLELAELMEINPSDLAKMVHVMPYRGGVKV